jgi:hypothetical protein
MCYLACDAYNLIEIRRRFRETFCLSHSEGTCLYTSTGLQKRHIADASNLHVYRYGMPIALY